MLYKSIVLELLQRQPRLHDRLRRTRKLLAAVNRGARMLKSRHEALRAILSRRTDTAPSQAANAAMEIAVRELETRLQRVSPPDDQRGLEAHRSRTPRG